MFSPSGISINRECVAISLLQLTLPIQYNKLNIYFEVIQKRIKIK